MGLREALADAGIALSLNPWTTTYHVSRGRRLRPGQNFRRMVGVNGAVSAIAVCPLCPTWQHWLCETFAYLATAMTPTAIWIEDDWRLHNHGPDLGWGGCFCDTHLQRFSEAVADTVDRETLLRQVLKPGPPHPWRRVWLRLCRDSLLEPAQRLRQEVAAVQPHVRLGLMSSTPDVHSAEGRDWEALQDALGRTPAFLIRPHMPPYTELRPLSTTAAVTRHTLANLQPPLEIYPELENSPRCGPYSKSAAYSVWECLHAACFGSHGITVNHFDMLGNGIALDPDFGPGLARAKPRLDALARLQLDDRNAAGARVLFSPRVSEAVHCPGPGGPEQLVNSSITWSETFYILGIAHSFGQDTDPESKVPVAVSGQTLRALDDAALERLLQGPLLLDGISAAILLERGCGARIGIRNAHWMELEKTGFAYEEIEQPDAAVYGVAYPRLSAQRCAGRLLAMEAALPEDVRSLIRDARQQPLAPGLILHRDPGGGRIVTLAYPLDGGAQFYMGFFNVFRRRWLQDLLFEIAPDAPLAAAMRQPLHLYRVHFGANILLALLNPAPDPAQLPELRLPHDQIVPDQLRALAPNGEWHDVAVACRHRNGCDFLELDTVIPALDALVLQAPAGRA